MLGSDSSSHPRESHLTPCLSQFSLEPLFSTTTHCLASYVSLAHVNWNCVQCISLAVFKMGGDVWTIVPVRVPQCTVIPRCLKGLFISDMKIEQRWEQFHVPRTVSFLSTLANGTIEVALKEICFQWTLDSCLKQISKWKALKVTHCNLVFALRLCELFTTSKKKKTVILVIFLHYFYFLENCKIIIQSVVVNPSVDVKCMLKSLSNILWPIYVILALGKWQQENQKFKVIFDYAQSLMPSWATKHLV